MSKLQHCLSNIFFIFLSLIPLLIVNFFFFLKDPPVWPDEPVFYEMAKNLLSSGKAVASIYSGASSGVEQTGLGYPPIYFQTLGLWTNLFGSQIESIRSLSLALGILSLVVFFIMLLAVFKDRFLATLGTITLSLNINFSRVTRLGRMEVMVFFFLVMSLLSLFIIKDKKKPYLFLLPGIFAGLAIMSHPIGAISVVVIFISTFFDKTNIKDKLLSLLFLILPVISLLIFWVLSFGKDFGSLLSTYGAHFADKSPKAPYAWVLFNSDPNWKFLFLVYIAIFIVSLVFFAKDKNKKSLIFIVGVLVSTAAFILAKEGGYMVYLQPFIISLLIYLFSLSTGKPSRLKLITITLFILVIVSNLNIQLFNNDNIAITGQGFRSVSKSQSYNYHEFTKIINDSLIKEEAGKNNRSIGIFVASVPDPYFDLKASNRSFYEAVDPDFPITDSSYKKILDSSDYLVLNWIPHKFLATYTNNNADKFIPINQSNGYSAVLVKLKPKDQRI